MTRIYVQSCLTCNRAPQAKGTSGMCWNCIKRFGEHDLREFADFIKRFYVWPERGKVRNGH